MTKPQRILTAFGKDLDDLLERAGKLSIREYADQAGVSYKYILQLRTRSARQPGRLYTSLLKPFVQLKVVNLPESHQLSIRHRGKPLTFTECKELFPDAPEQEMVAAVQQALASRGDKTAVQPAAALSPLYRRVFVGREAEVNQLKSLFDNAVTGQGSLVMVVGEPGIGKTALCEQLTDYVSTKGGKTLTGHCYSERSLSLPYLPFVESLGSYARGRDIIDLKKEAGTGAADIAHIIPEITDRLKVEPRPKRDPEEERYRLMQAVVGFLKNIAGDQPLLLVLEDLHNADKGTLDMLTHVSRNLAGTQLLLVGTYRDVEVDRTHPFSAALAELRRLPVFKRILLRGLNADEVNKMAVSTTGQEIPLSLAEAIYRQTEGNPLFVQEVCRYLVEEEIIGPQGEIKQKYRDMPVEMHIPDGLRDVISKRLSSLSEQCNQVLAVASVIGREFPLMLLERVTNLSDEDLFKALEEAKKAAVVEEKTGAGATVNYRFAHAFFRQTLNEEIIAPRRIRLHRQTARAIEEIYKNRIEEHAAQLAEHFSHSSDSADLKKAVNYGEIAAKRAMDVYAYGEAVRLLDQAINVQEILDPEDKAKRCDLSLDLCQALYYAGQLRRIVDVEARAALSLADAINDDRKAAIICYAAINSLVGFVGGLPQFMSGNPDLVWWVERLYSHARLGTTMQGWGDTTRGTMEIGASRYEQAVPLLRRALDIARASDDAMLYAYACNVYLYHTSAPHRMEERRELAEEWLSRVSIPTTIANVNVGALSIAANVLLEAGDRRRCEEYWQERRNAQEQARPGSIMVMIVGCDANIATFDGRLVEAAEIAEKIFAGCEAEGFPRFGINEGLGPGLRAWLLLGRTEKPLEILGTIPAPPLLLAHLGRNAEVVEILEKQVVARPSIGTTADEFPGTMDTHYLEAAVLVGHRKATDLLLRRFVGSTMRTTGWYFPTVIARHMGAAAVLLGRYDEAREHYNTALKVATEMPFRPEIALVRLGIAELLLEHYPDEKKEAIEHLDFCIKEFREMKMQPSLERALRHKEMLKA